ncbi:HsdM family class I SAM-dependent methyltransferase [Roseivirga pacifica]|uniref:HsdM family class I SAM-dependent methyltransferase n=1 Tax=Roseivirga pacifica TaxID=1267423 RepID=UPI003BAA75A7
MLLIKNASSEKLRGGFYTPDEITDFMVAWAKNGHAPNRVLEPSCGDGAFLSAIQRNSFDFGSLTAIEYDYQEAQKAESLSLQNAQIINTDFHDFCIDCEHKYDLILGNPPYIRYQYFDKEQQKAAGEIFDRANLKYSKLTNAWVSFVVGSSQLLTENGKMGFVLPAEILQVGYAKSLRKYLSENFNKVTIVSFETLVFDDIQQEVVLLFCEKNNSSSHKIEHIEVPDRYSLSELDLEKVKTPKKEIDFNSNKWTFYFLDQKEIDFIEELQSSQKIQKFGDYATVEVGITTGANPFFTVPLSVVEDFQLEAFVKPLVGRSVQVPSAIFRRSDWETNRKSNAKTHLLVFPNRSKMEGSLGALRYLELGETEKVNQGYKCSIRDEWQIIPSLWVSDALFIRRNNVYPKLIINEAQAYTTDTMHRVQIREGVNLKALTASYYNSLSLAFTEICGRSHGGGVLELMPSEVEEVFLPYSESNQELLDYVESNIRKATPIETILNHTDAYILKNGYGLNNKEIELARSIWKKLSNRRLKRGKRPKQKS